MRHAFGEYRYTHVTMVGRCESEECEQQTQHLERLMARFPYDQNLRAQARALRKNMTKSEQRLWSQLRRKQRGYTFNRQFIVDRYIVDFYARKLHLVIEVDGITHDYEESSHADIERQRALEALGITVLRFPSGRIFNEMNQVLNEIDACILRCERENMDH